MKHQLLQRRGQMELRVEQLARQSTCHYTGYVDFEQLAGMLKGYPFGQEVLDKAAMQKSHMNPAAVNLTIRMGPETEVRQEEGKGFFTCQELELRDGKSKGAAITLMEPKELAEKFARVHIFTVTQDKMARLENNQL